MGQNKLNKLELTWIGKYDEDKQPLEPRILIENPEYSYGEVETGVLPNGKPWNGNMLIHGDNLLALKSLEQDYAGCVKCIYIDPPYNTGNAFDQYDDNVEHSIWLQLMHARLQMLHRLLSEDGVIFVQINDDEAAYLKVLLDEVFGRSNYETTFYIKVRHEDRILREDIRYQLVMEQVFCYRKTAKYIPPRRPKEKNPLDDYEFDIEITSTPLETINIGGYDVEVYNPDSWSIIKQEKGKGRLKQYQIRGSLITQSGSAAEYYEKYLRARREVDGLGALYKVIGMGINGDGLGYRYIYQPFKADSKNGFYFQGKPLKVKENKGLPYPNYYDYVQLFNNAGYEGGVDFKGGKKPEAFLTFILQLAGVKKGDLVLDSFLGSGSTAATCSKLGHRWIGVEMGDHAYTHCFARICRTIDKTDDTGIGKCLECENGHGFRFYELAPSLLKTDKFGNLVINKEYNADMLAAAMAKQEGFTYSPSADIYWKQGFSSESDYIYTTTQFMTVEGLAAIAEQLKEGESLLVCCTAFQKECRHAFPNITIKKIPQMLLGRCEFAHDDYSFNIVSLPEVEGDYEDSGEDVVEKEDAASQNSQQELF
ncbi:MAG TPA: site-specific DNA-methyltransferase [Alistipes sp.]|uniref:site-specific DNA-methyltransferase n=1 Tax=unclassified Alistipes TaxID=2608932 RepID=UPI00258572F6|nr:MULTISPECIES: site-specific DNA-methyltransferase [unclassified Alistipes]HUN14251.1 site-specific DNA-methyltransferase [Alistipes sp.]